MARPHYVNQWWPRPQQQYFSSRSALAPWPAALLEEQHRAQRGSVAWGRAYEVETRSGELEQYTSVTTVLGALSKPGLEKWKCKVALQDLFG
eukprot:COSAG01_NODE_1079_length_11822_cov_4.368762_15_plen_92_part_00